MLRDHYKIRVEDVISEKGLSCFKDSYELGKSIEEPDGILVRSSPLTPESIPHSTRVIVRAGVGVNNIPVDYCSDKGIPVINTPGANANAVKELTLAALFTAARNIIAANNFVDNLSPQDEGFIQTVEQQKKLFRGTELRDKILGVVGMGTIGRMVAEAALNLGMVINWFDPFVDEESLKEKTLNAAQLNCVANLEDLFKEADFISLHLPLMAKTKALVDGVLLKQCKPGVHLINFARGEIVDNKALLEALENNGIKSYFCDFPAPELWGKKQVICLPHIGASTQEAQDNCAVLAVQRIMTVLETGAISDSVNFPTLSRPSNNGYRITVTNRNVPKMLGRITSVFADAGVNVIEMGNQSYKSLAYNIIDIESKPKETLINNLRNIEGVDRVWTL